MYALDALSMAFWEANGLDLFVKTIPLAAILLLLLRLRYHNLFGEPLFYLAVNMSRSHFPIFLDTRLESDPEETPKPDT